MENCWKNLFDKARKASGSGHKELAQEKCMLSVTEAEKLPKSSREYSSSQLSFSLWCFQENRFIDAEKYHLRHIELEIELGIGKYNYVVSRNTEVSKEPLMCPGREIM